MDKFVNGIKLYLCPCHCYGFKVHFLELVFTFLFYHFSHVGFQVFISKFVCFQNMEGVPKSFAFVKTFLLQICHGCKNSWRLIGHNALRLSSHMVQKFSKSPLNDICALLKGRNKGINGKSSGGTNPCYDSNDILLLLLTKNCQRSITNKTKCKIEANYPNSFAVSFLHLWRDYQKIIRIWCCFLFYDLRFIAIKASFTVQILEKLSKCKNLHLYLLFIISNRPLISIQSQNLMNKSIKALPVNLRKEPPKNKQHKHNCKRHQALQLPFEPHQSEIQYQYGFAKIMNNKKMDCGKIRKNLAPQPHDSQVTMATPKKCRHNRKRFYSLLSENSQSRRHCLFNKTGKLIDINFIETDAYLQINIRGHQRHKKLIEKSVQRDRFYSCSHKKSIKRSNSITSSLKKDMKSTCQEDQLKIKDQNQEVYDQYYTGGRQKSTRTCLPQDLLLQEVIYLRQLTCKLLAEKQEQDQRLKTVI